MSWFVSDERIAVPVGDCLCPGSPHPDGDTIWLRSELTPAGGLAAMAQFSGEPDEQQMIERLGRVYLEHGIVAWTFTDENGPVPVNVENIRRLTWAALWPVAERASKMYSEGFVRPLVARGSRSSRNGQTTPLTSPKARSSRVRPKR